MWVPPAMMLFFKMYAMKKLQAPNFRDSNYLLLNKLTWIRVESCVLNACAVSSIPISTTAMLSVY